MPSSNYEDHEVSKIPKIEETEQNFNLNLQWEVIQGGLDKLGGSSAIFSSICHGNTDQTFWLDRLATCQILIAVDKLFAKMYCNEITTFPLEESLKS